MDLAELQREAHAIAKDHGWWDEERSFGDLIALVHSELSEALEAYRAWGMQSYQIATDGSTAASPPYEPVAQKDWKPEGVPSELADVVIRVADMAEHHGMDLDMEARDTPFIAPETFGEWIADAHSFAVAAYICKRNDEKQCNWFLSRVIAHAQRMAAHYGIDLDAAIEAKMEYNRGRSYRHGGKAL